MRTARLIRIVPLLAAMLVSPAAFAAAPTDLERTLSHDGLQKVDVKGIDLAFARPGATLAAYKRVKLDPVEVAFRKDWDPTKPGSRVKLSAEERENIRAGTAKIVLEEFAKELRSKGSYQVVDETGPDVLRVKVSIVNLYVNAPDTMSAGRTRSYTVSAGEMTLFAELFDSETGAIMARVVDRQEARGSGGMTLSNSVVNAGEAQDIASGWARILRNALDKAQGIGKK
jgi:Protein of unknown function (DUF3313)